MGATPPIKVSVTGMPQATQPDGEALIVGDSDDDCGLLPDCDEVWVATAARDWEFDRLLDEEAGGGACDSDANWLSEGATLDDGVEPWDCEGVVARVDEGKGKVLDDAV